MIRSSTAAPPDRKGMVRFRVRDVALPPANELLDALWGDRLLEGQVVARSRSAADGDCVVVQILGSDRLVVVSEERILKDS